MKDNSWMAKGIARSLVLEGAHVFSAGSNPGRLNPLAMKALAEVGIGILGPRSKGMGEVPADQVDSEVTRCAEENIRPCRGGFTACTGACRVLRRLMNSRIWSVSGRSVTSCCGALVSGCPSIRKEEPDERVFPASVSP